MRNLLESIELLIESREQKLERILEKLNVPYTHLRLDQQRDVQSIQMV